MEEKKQSYNLVEFNSQMNKVAFHNFKAIDLDLFMAICYRMKRKGTILVNLSFDEVLNLLPSVKNTIKRDNSKLEKNLKSMYKKLLNLSFSFENAKEYVEFVLFTKFRVDKEKKNIEIKVNEEFSFVLNQIAKEYTGVELEYFSNFKSVYSKHLYKILKQFQNEKKRDEHWCELQMEDFRNRLDVPTSYNIDAINKRVLKPIQEDIGAVLQNFTIEKKKNGKTIVAYRFSWTTGKQKIKNIEAETIEVCEIEEYWKNNFPGVNYSFKHKEKIEKFKKKHSIQYIKNYLQEQWEYVKNNPAIENGPAYFSQLILEEKAVFKDYEKLNKKEYIDPEEDKIQAENFVGTLFENIEKNTTRQEQKIEEDIEIEQQALFIKEITKEEYNEMYQIYLEKTNLQDDELQKKVFSLMNRNKYKIIEKKIYTAADIPEEKLLSKSGKKLVGAALKMKIEKILEEMNK